MTPRRRALLVCALAALWGLWVCAHSFTRAATWYGPLVDHPIREFPFWREALLRAMRAFFGASITAAAAWQLGRHLTGPMRDLTADPIERGQFTLAIGAVAMTSLMLLLALAGAYRPPFVLASVLLVCASRPRGALADLTALRRLIGSRLGTLRLGIEDAALSACLALATVSVIVAALAPETEYDALWTHLWLPTQWLAAGRLVDMVSEYVALYPGGWELLNGAALSAGGPVAAKLLHTACLPLVAIAAVLLGRRVAPDAPPLLIATLVVGTPLILWEASTAYVDLALAWFTTLTVIALLHHDDSQDQRWLVVAAVCAGGALGVKHLGLVVLAVCAAALVLTGLRRRRVRSVLASTAILVALAVALAAPWYARAYAASGNPVFPDLYRVFGARPETRWSEEAEAGLDRFKARFGMGHSLAAVVSLPWTVTTHAARFGGVLGPLYLVLIPFAMFGRARRELKAVAAGCVAYGLIWASPLGSLQLRFVIPLIPFLAVIASSGAATLTAQAGALHRVFARAPVAAIIALLLLNLPAFTDWHETERRGWDGWLTHVLRALPAAVVVGAESEQAYLSRMVPTYRAWRAIDSSTPPDSRVLTFSGGDHLYSHRWRLWSDATIAYPIVWGARAGKEAAMLAAARRTGITHVLFDRRQLAGPDVPALAIGSVRTRACCLIPFYEDERVVVYRLVGSLPEHDSAVPDR